MDFTELIRKANLAKKEVENTRNTADEIKAKLIENGAEIEESTKFEELPNIISESNLGNSKWKRPKKWLDMPNIIMEESKYIPLMMKQQSQQPEQATENLDTNNFSESFQFFLNMTEGANLSEVTTHVDGNNFYVSANDMAYIMLCDISKNSNDNIITFEGVNLAGSFPFTDINTAYTDNNKTPFLSDLFIQIDNETPLNLSELSRGNITLPTSGKYKNISIIDKVYSYDAVSPQSTDNIEVMEARNSLVEHAINTNANEYNAPLISFMIKLNYEDFSDNTLINNKKQCIIKVWCNNFNYILPTFGVNNNPFLTKYDVRNIRKINSCIREISICENEYPYINNLIIPSYDLLLYGIGENVNKMNILNSFISVERIKNTRMSILLNIANTYNNNLSNRYYNTDMSRPENQMDLKEIDLSNSKYYDGFIALTNILLNSPLLRDMSFCEITRKLENVEKITFPNFKENFDTSQDSDTIIGNFENFFIMNRNIEYYVADGKYRYATPLCMNLALFKKINKETIIDLINKLPIINKKFSEINMNNIVSINRSNVQPSSLSLNEQSNIFYNAEIDKKYFKGNTDMIKEFVEKIDYTKCILDFSIISEKDTTLEESSDNSQITVLDNNPAVSTLADFMGRDGKIFYTLLIPNDVYDLLTEEEKNTSIEKGWKIVTGYNYPINDGGLAG